MPDPTPPTTKPTTPASRSELPPRLLAKLKVEIDGYELLDRLDEGGQATVYKCIQKKDGRVVAIKVLHGGPHATDEARARLKREINALRAINHPSIVHAIAADRTRSGLDCLVMNFIDGKPLDALWTNAAFAANVAPQPADLLRLFKTICETVQAAHRKGITHRDLSPSNILIDATGQPHILDFGMASTAFDGIVNRNVTVTGQFIGKLKYASPEQASGARTPGVNGEAGGGGVDIRSDVYALGVMLYQLLTGGAFPYEVVGNIIDVLHNIIHSKPKPPSETVAELHTPTNAMAAGFGGTLGPPVTKPTGASTPVRRNPRLVNETIEAIVLKALEKDPAQRYQSAGELAADIDRYLAGQPTSAVVWSKRPNPASSSRPFRRAAAIAASLVLVATLVGVSMNAKTLAVWLGLATAAVPVLPTELAPLAPSTANAAMLEAAQPEGSDRRLNTLATDLARVEARLRAVNKQLASATSRKPSEIEERPAGGSGPLSTDDFVAGLVKSSTETGRELRFDALGKEDREREEQAEAERLGRETDQDVLLKRRAELDAEQGALWTRLGWGTFTGRDPDKLYRFRLKSPVMADANVTAKNRLLESGIKVRRLAQLAMDAGATSIRTPAGADGNGKADLAKVLSEVAEQLRTALADFQKAASAAKDAGNLSDDESKAVADLRKLADRLRDALDGCAESQGQAVKAQDEQARFAARGTLQRDLRDVTDAALRLDSALVKLAGDWKMDVDLASALPDVKLPMVATKPKVEKPKPAPAEKKKETEAVDELAAWTVGSKWVTKNRAGGNTTWTVRSRNGDELEIQRTSVAIGSVVVSLKIKGKSITVTRVRHDDGNTCMDRDWNGSGTIGPKSLSLTYSVDSNCGKGWGRWDESINLKPE
ncbi:MAG: serine/threonine protein kinase [Phycisphaerales bacterium]